MITELSNSKTDSYEDLKKIILCNNFPWNYYGATVDLEDNTDLRLLSHVFLYRPGLQYPYPKRASEYTDLATFVCQQILGMNGIEVHMFYRMAVNMVIDTTGVSPKHTDHPYPHDNLIIYMSEFDKGKTLVYDEEDNEHSIPTKEDMAITFDGKYTHCHEAPSSGRRVALVATYLKQ